jgi:hypothetical protein
MRSSVPSLSATSSVLISGERLHWALMCRMVCGMHDVLLA